MNEISEVLMSKKEKKNKKDKKPFESTGEVPIVRYSSTIPHIIVERTSPVTGALKLASFFNVIAWLTLFFGTIGSFIAGWNESHVHMMGKWYAVHDATSHFLGAFFWTFAVICILSAFFAFFGFVLRLLCELITKRVIQ